MSAHVSRQNPLYIHAALAFLLTLGACAEFTVYRYQNVYRMIEPVVSSEKKYVDDNIEIRFWIDQKKIRFRLKNRTDEPLTIDWKKASFINIDGVKYSLANKDSIFTSRNRDPDPTTIEPGAAIIDFVAPVNNVEKLEEWTWYVYPLFNLVDREAIDNKGKKFGVEFPMKAKGQWRVYAFMFEVTNVMPSLERTQ